ncbi:opacity family porin [Gallibacterium genomosp. 1]|uniref:Porin n=1 Tax=Gallibacterium genomosp. 1 TaxID=155515 RepID=A0AB36DV51_9PAST|nr:opacity family porin [Gallibacterium genomosp. 1]OBX00161.1 porin [Gallibacterium genomosp. 1]OBX02342.1 porin [Gallibacterium genomosp. 1]
MKKLLVVALGALALASTAQAEWYVQGNLGYSKIKTSGLEDGNLNKSKATPSVAIGYKLGDIRLALDYSHYGNINDHYRLYDANGYTEGKNEFKIHGVGFSALYDIDLQSNIKPYVGVRVASNKVKSSSSSVYKQNNGGTYNQVEKDASESSTKFGYGALVGASYDLMPNLALDVAAEYNILGKFDDVKVKQYGVKAGLRYTF